MVGVGVDVLCPPISPLPYPPTPVLKHLPILHTEHFQGKGREHFPVMPLDAGTRQQQLLLSLIFLVICLMMNWLKFPR